MGLLEEVCHRSELCGFRNLLLSPVQSLSPCSMRIELSGISFFTIMDSNP